MDLDQALKLAGDESGNWVGRPGAACPNLRTGLLVLVYRNDETKAVIENADVSRSGALRRTDSNGIAHYKPCTPGEYDVAVTSLPDAGKLYATPYPTAHKTVTAATCPICPLPVELRKYWIKVRIVEKDTGKDIDRSEVKIKLPDGWKSGSGETEEQQATAEEGAAPNTKKIAHFKGILAGAADASKCTIDFVESEVMMEFVESTTG